MDREVRFKIAGILFYVSFALPLIFTEQGLNFCRVAFATFNQDPWPITGLLVAGGVISVFSSVSVGYVFSTLVFSFWNLYHISADKTPKEVIESLDRTIGFNYALEWELLDLKLNEDFLKEYGADVGEIKDDQGKVKATFRYKDYSADVFLSYFWQQAPKSLVEWVGRRHTFFYLGQNAILAIFSGVSLALLTALKTKLLFSYGGIGILLFLLLLCGIIGLHSRAARIEARDMINLWLARKYDKKAREALEKIGKGLKDEKDAAVPANQGQRG